MTSFDRERLSTVQLVLLTPFSEDGALRPQALEEFAGHYFEYGMRVFLPAAGTSEFHSLTADEVIQCVAAVKRSVGSEAVVVAPIGFGLPHALAIGKGAEQAGADAVLIMPPVHPYLSDSGLRDYYLELMRKLTLPVLIYKKGPFPSDELLVELSGMEQFVGVKYAANDLNAFNLFAAECKDRLGLYCGSAERFAPFFFLAGATGYTTGAGNLCPNLTLSLHRALKHGDYTEAMSLLAVLRPIEDYRARSGDSYNVSMLKHGLKVIGYDFGEPRPPMRRLTDDEQAQIKSLVSSIATYESEMTRERFT